MDQKLYDTLFQLKLTSRTLEKQSQKRLKEMNKQKQLIQKAIKQGNTEGAKIYAENAIREKNCSKMFLTMSSRIDGVRSQIEMQQSMKSVVGNIEMACQGLQSASANMDLNKINGILDNFQMQFDKIDVMDSVLTSQLDQVTSGQVANNEVENLIEQMVAEENMHKDQEFGKVKTTGEIKVTPAQQQIEQQQQDDVEKRLAALLASD